MIIRHLERYIKALLPGFKAIFLTGPRQAALEDPAGFLERLRGSPGVILDEVQRAPDIFSYLQQPLDERKIGPVILNLAIW